MIGLRGRWPIWGMRCVIRRSAIFCNATLFPPAPERKRATTWPAFIRTHLALLAGTDFFTAEVLTLRGLLTYYVLFFIHLKSRRVDIAGITIQPDERWMQQIARNATMEGCGALRDCRYLLHDGDTKYTQSFRAIIASARIEPLVLPARSPNLNAYAERWVRSVKEECLSKVVLFGERSLRRALGEYVEHYHAERNHHRLDVENILRASEWTVVEIAIVLERQGGQRRNGVLRCLGQVFGARRCEALYRLRAQGDNGDAQIPVLSMLSIF